MQRLGGSIGVSILGAVVVGKATTLGTVDAFHQVGLILMALAAGSALLAGALGRRDPSAY